MGAIDLGDVAFALPSGQVLCSSDSSHGVTHDRWSLAGLDRFLVFDRDQRVGESLEPPE